MPLLVELVIPSYSVPLQIVVAPGAVVDGVADDVDVVVPAVALPADSCGDGWLGTGILEHRGAREHRIRERVGNGLSHMPRHRFGANGDPQLHEPVLVQGACG